MSDAESTRLFRSAEYDQAAERLRKGLEDQGENGRDLLLYLLDLGITLHTAGKYEESNKYLLQANDIAEIKDYTSLATEGATLLVTDNIKDYKGEDFEKVLINTYLAMNFALMGNYEDALVEARLVNRKLHLMVTEGQRKYKQNAFARYLAGVLYEADRHWNDAYVDYKLTRELMPELPGLGRDLWRMAWLLKMPDEMERWNREYKLGAEDHRSAKEVRKGEIIVIYQNGISPIKKPNPDFHSLPRFVPRANPVSQAEVVVSGKPSEVHKTILLHDVEKTAIENLDEKYAGLVAKKIGGVVAKEVVAHQIGKSTDSPLVGLLASLALHAGDRADLRSWNLLPKDLQIVRIPVEPGTHTVRLTPIGAEALPEKTVEVAPGKKVFVSFRYVP